MPIIGQTKNKAQSTLELTLSFMVIVILLFGTLRVFAWMAHCIVGRDRAYLTDFTHNFNNPDDSFYTPPRVDLLP